MSATVPTLSNATIARVQSGWAKRLKISPDKFLSNDMVLVLREDFLHVVSLQLQETVVVVCPASLESLLSPLNKSDLMNMSRLLAVLMMHNPEPVGTANIAYADGSTLVKPISGAIAHQASSDEVGAVMSACTSDEQDESGLDDMTIRFAVSSIDGRPAAIAGYEIWNDDIAQLGVLTAPQHRGRGLASVVAWTAASVAIDAGLVPQWRSRLDNQPSNRLGQKLGFTNLGKQLSLLVMVS